MTVPAENFVATIAANVDNDKLTDAEFRSFIRRSLPVVDYATIRNENWPVAAQKEPMDDPELQTMAQERYDELASKPTLSDAELREFETLSSHCN